MRDVSVCRTCLVGSDMHRKSLSHNGSRDAAGEKASIMLSAGTCHAYECSDEETAGVHAGAAGGC